MEGFLSKTHIRKNILTGGQVLVSPHRTKRPWQGKKEEVPLVKDASYDQNCYLCPGNTRSGGGTNPEYKETYSFINDFSALLPEGEKTEWDDGLLKAHTERGICKVICFSPDHSQTFSQMNVGQIEKVISTWKKEFIELSKNSFINNIQIFENKGASMGCSNPHPHGQIWAQETIPLEITLKTKHFSEHTNISQNTLLEDYLKQEQSLDLRIVDENEHFVTLVPFWAIWPYETMIIPKIPRPSITGMTENEKHDLAKSIQTISKIYDKVFDVSFPYSGGIHQAPVNGKINKGWHWHMSFYPPLLRSATIKKFMVGYEMFGMPQRDITAEQAADVLKRLK